MGGVCPGGCLPMGVYTPREQNDILTDRGKNITLPQTSFAGGKKKVLKWLVVPVKFIFGLQNWLADSSDNSVK